MTKLTQAYEDFKQNVSNKYLDFIQECRDKYKSYSKEEQDACYTHHIVPKHHYRTHHLNKSTFNLPTNTVRLTFEDHLKAHELRYEVYNEYGDLSAFKRMSGLQQEGMRAMQQAGGQAVNLKYKEEGRFMHNSDWQKEMAKRSMSRSDALQIRSEGGKKGGRKRHENRVVRMEDRYEWLVEGQPFLCTFNFNSGGDLLRALQAARPTNLQRVSPLLNGERARLHGWSCRKIEDVPSEPTL